MWLADWLSFSFAGELEQMRLSLSSIFERDVKLEAVSPTFFRLANVTDSYVSILRKPNSERFFVELSGRAFAPGNGGFALGEKIFQFYRSKGLPIALSRIDVKRDFADVTLSEVVNLESLKAKVLTAETELQMFKANNAGEENSVRLVQKNMKLRIYDRIFEIQNRAAKGLSDFDKEILEKYDSYTRFELELRTPITAYANSLFETKAYESENDLCEKVAMRYLRNSTTEQGQVAFVALMSDTVVERRRPAGAVREHVRRSDSEEYTRAINGLRSKARKWGFLSRESRRSLFAMLLVALELDETATELWVKNLPTYEELIQRYLEDQAVLEEFKRIRKLGSAK